MNKIIHIWEFPNVSVKLSSKFLKTLKKEIKNKYKIQKEFYLDLNIDLPFTSFKNMLKLSNPNFIPIDILIKCCKKLEISIYNLEKNVIAYRSSKGRRTIIKPKLPIKLSPRFYMILSHIMADGNCIRIPGRSPYFSYRQYDKEFLDSFVKKILSEFGEIDLKISETRVYLPATISMVMANKANIEPREFLSKIARIPEDWFNLEKEEKLAILLAFIIDEGHIDSGQIVIGLHNRALLSDLKKICDQCNYSASLTSRLYILSKGVKSLWRDYCKFKHKFSSVTLGYKEKKIEEFILRNNKLWRSKGQGQTKNLIIQLLKNNPMTINELATILKISRQGIRFHIKKMKKLNLVSENGLAKNAAVIYTLNVEHTFKTGNRGRSKQKRVTKKNILELLYEEPRTSVWLSNKLNIHKSTILKFLYSLEKRKLIYRVGKKTIKTHPAILWKIKD